MVRRLLLPTVAALGAALLPGCPSCPYDEACDGDVLLTCWLGPDQLVGDPAETATPCAAPNPTCVTVDDRNALCAMDPARRCDAGAPPRCEGGLLVTCVDGHEVGYDCVAHGNLCGAIEGEARCFRAPLTECGSNFEYVCDGDRRVLCEAGVVATVDCGVRRAGARCVERPTTSGGRSAYCSP